MHKAHRFKRIFGAQFYLIIMPCFILSFNDGMHDLIDIRIGANKIINNIKIKSEIQVSYSGQINFARKFGITA